MSVDKDIEVLRECAGLCMCENIGPEDALNSVARVVTEVERLGGLWEQTVNERDGAHNEIERLKVDLAAANALLVRAQDGSPKRPREANRDQIQLDYDIGQHMHRCGYVWNAVDRKWVPPAV